MKFAAIAGDEAGLGPLGRDGFPAGACESNGCNLLIANLTSRHLPRAQER